MCIADARSECLYDGCMFCKRANKPSQRVDLSANAYDVVSWEQRTIGLEFVAIIKLKHGRSIEPNDVRTDLIVWNE